jgi:hypothetical protein
MDRSLGTPERKKPPGRMVSALIVRIELLDIAVTYARFASVWI